MRINVIASLALMLGAQVASASSALAWGCVAQGSGTSFGYSHSYNSRSEAESRALAECRDRGSSCVVVSCDPNK